MVKKKATHKQCKDQKVNTDQKSAIKDTKTDLKKKDSTIEIRKNSSPVCFAESDEIQEEYKIDVKENLED